MIKHIDSKVTSQQCVEFVEGLTLLKDSLITQAQKKFQHAYITSTSDDFYHNKYASYYGLTRVLLGDGSGVELCRLAANNETFDGDVFLNLAYAEWYLNRRKKSVDVLEQGLTIDDRHPGLNKLKQRLGERQRPAIKCIPRDSFLNVAFGRLARRREIVDGCEFRKLM